MSVVIKGAEMPKNCYDCPLSAYYYKPFFGNGKYVSGHYICVLTKKKMTSTKRNRFCPLEEGREAK